MWLVLAHIGGAIAARVVLAQASPFIPQAWEAAFSHLPEIGERDLVVVNDPAPFSAMAPFECAYRGRPLPRSVRNLTPGFTGLVVSRPDADTLTLKAKEGDLFECPALGPLHFCYACKAANDFLFQGRTFKAGDRVIRRGFTVQIQEVSARGAPRSVAIRFGRALESDGTVWLFFDWRRMAHLPFVLPQIGETVEIAGAGR